MIHGSVVALSRLYLSGDERLNFLVTGDEIVTSGRNICFIYRIRHCHSF